MGVLDSILEYKRQKEAQANADIAAIPQGVNAFLQAREQSRKSALDEMLMQQNQQKINNDLLGTRVTAAKSGLEIGQDGTISVNKDLQTSGGGNILLVGNDGQVETVGQFAKGDKTFKKNLTPDEVSARTEAQRKATADNPMVSQETQGAIASYQYIQPRIEKINSILENGAFKGDGFTRLAKQITVGKGGELIVPDGSPLEDLVGALNEIKLTGFGLGGKNFTENEAKIVFGRLDPTGKSDARFKKDIAGLEEFFKLKANAGTMGLTKARETMGGASKSDGSTNTSDGYEYKTIGGKQYRRKVTNG